MAKHMHEEIASTAQPRGHSRQQVGPVAHVLKHFHRDNPVEAPLGGKIIHVRSHHFKIPKPPASGLIVDPALLGCGIGDRGDIGGGIPLRHPQGK